jgi:hypothetical protein
MRDRTVERRIFVFARLLVAAVKIFTLVGLTSLSARAESITFWKDFGGMDSAPGQPASGYVWLPTFDSTFGTLTNARFTLDFGIGFYIDISPKDGVFDTSFDGSVSMQSDLILFNTRNGYLGNDLFGGSLTFDTGVVHIQSGDPTFHREQGASLVLHSSNGDGYVTPESFSTSGPQEALFVLLLFTSTRGTDIPDTDVIGNQMYVSSAGGRVGVTYDYISAIPEPQTYAMLLAGLGLLGLTARRRKQLQS